MPHAILDFTDGDTLKRFTITDASVRASDLIDASSLNRRYVADADDVGWVFVPTVVSVADGSFDVLVAALSGDAPAAPGEFPNETLVLIWRIANS